MFNDIKTAFKMVGPKIFSKKNAPRLSAAAVVTAMSTALNLFSAYLLSQALIVENDEKSDLGLTLPELASLFVGAMVLSKALQTSRRLIVNPVVSETGFSMPFDIDKHFLSLSHSHFTKTPIGTMSENFTTGSIGAQELTFNLLNNIIPPCFESFSAIGIAYGRLGVYPGVVFTAMFLLYTFYNLIVAGYIAEAQKELVKNKGAMTRTITANLINFEPVQIFNNVAYELLRVQNTLTLVKKANTKSLSLPDKIAMGQWAIIGSGFGGVLLLTYNHLEPEMFVAVAFYMLMFSNLFSGFGDGLSKAKAACTNLETVGDVFKKKPEVLDNFPNTPLHISQSAASIKFKNVSFTYPGTTTPIIQDLSFEVERGQTVAIVGESGAGKSTITRLLERFYDNQIGEITIEGQNIRTVSIISLRDALGIVPQNATVFNTSIKDNIWYGAISKFGIEADSNKINQAIDRAALRTFVDNLPDGEQTIVGERGLKVSGGQLQRIGIARAIIRDAAILIFDEPTSALDSKTEEEIQQNFKTAATGKTTLLITHKLNHARTADKIIVLQKGGIKVDEGTHDELLGRCELYESMWEKQSKEYEEKPVVSKETAQVSSIRPSFFSSEPSEAAADLSFSERKKGKRKAKEKNRLDETTPLNKDSKFGIWHFTKNNDEEEGEMKEGLLKNSIN